ncbi:MAG TPA: aspartate aminotransferase family protein, partial [Spirochaetota bacterium]|nr:aspartate aminotransferase family protein [Spirochaetota bacterium]
MSENKNSFVDPFKPYKGRFASYDRIPDTGRDREDIFRELSTMSEEENAKWQNGKVSGTFYHAGAEHRAFLNRIFSLFSHVNVLQVDLCPSMSKFESEVVAMTAAMLHGDAPRALKPEDEVCGT